jgi:uncharacterized protein YbjT (DUF2867 family)
MQILVVGAGGYVGGRLVPRLLAAGHELTLASRQPAVVSNRFPDVRVLVGDPIDDASLRGVVEGVEIVYHLPETIVHHGSEAWADEIRAAEVVGAAAAAAGVGRIIHLGELGDAPPGAASSRPGARCDQGEALARSGAPVLEFRASLIIGSGSAPFEMVRHLTDRIPIMTTPRWVKSPAQPIAIRQVLGYLLAALDREVTGVVEIGGPEVLSFAEMLLEYARIRGLRRVWIPLPVATLAASDAWVSLVSPLPRGVARVIIERLRNGAVVREGSMSSAFGIVPMSYAEAISLALERTVGNEVETTWFDTLETRSRRRPTTLHPRKPPATPLGAPEPRRLVDRRSMDIPAAADRVFEELERLGGPAGWPTGDFLWRIRGLLDRLVGGIGMRLGRRDQVRLRVGDALDFWRVEELERPRLLRLSAEMRVPGRAWLEFVVEPTPVGSRLVQTAYFDPNGLAGYAYWYFLLPIHQPIFRGMIRVLADRAATPRTIERRSDGVSS